MQTDRIFQQHSPQAGGFQFDDNVARVFDDMISRSIPLYADVQRAIPKLAAMLDHQPVRIVDLGCSTGTSLIHLARSMQGENVELVGVDNSQPMLDKLHEKLAALDLATTIDTFCADIESFDFQDSSIVLMNYTLQFLPPEKRPELLQRIRSRIKPGGFLVLSEKFIHGDPQTDHALTELYFDFKRRHGYTELEIARKREALENVLVPLSTDDNLQMLREAGFARSEVLLKWFNFATIVAYH